MNQTINIALIFFSLALIAQKEKKCDIHQASIY